MSRPIWIIEDSNICKTCQHSKNRFKESCYCTMYGIIVTYGKRKCKDYEQIRKQESDGGRIIIREV